MRILVLDVETLTDRYVQPEGKEPQFPNVSFHDPVVVTWLKINTVKPAVAIRECYRETHVEEYEHEWLRAALVDLSRDLHNADRLVTFNGRGFDMPLLQLWAWKLGVPWGFWQNLNDRYPRYNKPLFHWDLCDRAADGGAARYMSLDNLCKFFGLPGKPDDIDGGKVGEVWKVTPSKVVNYCLDDVVQTWLCASKVMNEDALAQRMLAQRILDLLADRLPHPREAYEL